VSRGDAPVRYVSADEDSDRWSGFPFRAGDIVISTRSKHGTTWMQMICLLLVFQQQELPAPLAEVSPWLDWKVAPRDEVWARLAAQPHRRVMKTHTPLDGLPLDSRVSYIVVARHPLDAAVSLYHQGDNLDRRRMRELTGQPASSAAGTARPPLHAWLRSWIDHDAVPAQDLDSLPGVMWHLSDAWSRRDEPNVTLVHYDALAADLASEMRRLAAMLDISVPDATWPDLVLAAQFDQMRARADLLAPDALGVLIDRSRFFRHGSSGDGVALLSADELEHYHRRAAALAPTDLLSWLHRDDRSR
jgi:aryl sulfotransferase